MEKVDNFVPNHIFEGLSYIYFYMKVFGFFNIKSEKKFVNITCNLILSVMVIVVFGLSIFSPLTVETVSLDTNAIYYGNKNSNKVCLMVNVYWGTEYLNEMLDIFESENVKTTFFVGGCWVNKNVEALRKIYDSGHEIANHGYNHLDSVNLSQEKLEKEIKLTEDIVFNFTGVRTNLFAPPSGSVNGAVVKKALALNYKTIMWTHDTIDWRDKDENLIFKRATKNTVGGDLILMHPTLCTKNALRNIIVDLKNKGLELTTVSNVLEWGVRVATQVISLPANLSICFANPLTFWYSLKFVPPFPVREHGES